MYFAIVDDMAGDLERLASLLQEDCLEHREPVEFARYTSGTALLEDFRPGLYSAVFLDILMNGMSGIDTARSIRKQDEHIPIIFTTSEKDYALDSYDVHALDYLTKPLQKNRLAWCMQRLRDTMASPLYIEIRGVFTDGKSAPEVLPLDDILYLESIRNGLMIHTPGGSIRMNRTFGEFVRQLPENGCFFECGRGLMINFSQVSNILESGEIQIYGGTSVFCSRRRIRDTRAAYAEYQFSMLRKGGSGK